MSKVKTPLLLLEIPHFEQNEITSKGFIKKRSQFKGEKYNIAVKWLTKKVKQLFHFNYNIVIYICHAKFMNVNAVVEKLTLVKPFAVSRNVGQNIILLRINQNQPNILLITKNILLLTKNTPSSGVFYLLLKKMAEHLKT